MIVIRETSGRTLTALRNGVKLFSMPKRLHKVFYARVTMARLFNILKELYHAGIMRILHRRRVQQIILAGKAIFSLVKVYRTSLALWQLRGFELLARLVAPEPLVVAEPEIMPTIERMPEDEYQTLAQDIELGHEVMKMVKGEPCNPQIILKGLGIDVEQKRDYLPIQ